MCLAVRFDPVQKSAVSRQRITTSYKVSIANSVDPARHVRFDRATVVRGARQQLEAEILNEGDVGAEVANDQFDMVDAADHGRAPD